MRKCEKCEKREAKCEKCEAKCENAKQNAKNAKQNAKNAKQNAKTIPQGNPNLCKQNSIVATLFRSKFICTVRMYRLIRPVK
jgi:hypothetical protein